MVYASNGTISSLGDGSRAIGSQPVGVAPGLDASLVWVADRGLRTVSLVQVGASSPVFTATTTYVGGLASDGLGGVFAADAEQVRLARQRCPCAATDASSVTSRL